jgi:hypothetical protein
MSKNRWIWIIIKINFIYIRNRILKKASCIFLEEIKIFRAPINKKILKNSKIL